jgi:MHS family proline/betaine transporter-like MFS transporter
VPLYLTSLFPSKVRLTGVALAYNLSVATVAGAAPLVVTFFIERTQQLVVSPVAYILFFMLIATLGMLRLPNVNRK